MLIVSSLLGACTNQDPYVDRPYKINRENVDFPNGPEIVDGLQVVVCYAKSYATPAEIRSIADNECAQGGLKAQFKEQAYNTCSLVAPVAAIFICKGNTGVATASQSRLGSIVAPSASVPALSRVIGTIGAEDVSTTAKSAPFPTFLFNSGQSTK